MFSIWNAIIAIPMVFDSCQLVHIGVGFELLVSLYSGNARASECGTSNEWTSPRLFCTCHWGENDIVSTGMRIIHLSTKKLIALWNAPTVEKKSRKTQYSVASAERKSREMMYFKTRSKPLRMILPTTLQIMFLSTKGRREAWFLAG